MALSICPSWLGALGQVQSMSRWGQARGAGAGHGAAEPEHVSFSFPPLLLPSRSQRWGLLLAQNVHKAS